MSLAPDVDLESLAGAATERHTGADLKAICREAAMEALRGMRDANVVVRAMTLESMNSVD